jgi:hypothetical protein
MCILNAIPINKIDLTVNVTFHTMLNFCTVANFYDMCRYKTTYTLMLKVLVRNPKSKQLFPDVQYNIGDNGR